MKRAFLLILLFITACKPTNSKISILKESSCEPPCWNGITPGTTTYSEASQILTKLAGIDSENVVDLNQPWKIFNRYIRFVLYKNSPLTTVQTDGEIYFIDNEVVALLLQRNIGKTFGEMIEIAGKPEMLISMPFNGGGPEFTAIITSSGVMFEFYANSKELRSDTKIDNVIFFDPMYYEELLDIGLFSQGAYNANETKTIIYPWKGYGSIDELYPPRIP